MFELKLREIRKARNISQEALAEMIGETASKVGAWERQSAKLPINVAWKMADVLNCSLDELAGRVPMSHPENFYVMETGDDGTVTFRKADHES